MVVFAFFFPLMIESVEEIGLFSCASTINPVTGERFGDWKQIFKGLELIGQMYTRWTGRKPFKQEMHWLIYVFLNCVAFGPAFWLLTNPANTFLKDLYFGLFASSLIIFMLMCIELHQTIAKQSYCQAAMLSVFCCYCCAIVRLDHYTKIKGMKPEQEKMH